MGFEAKPHLGFNNAGILTSGLGQRILNHERLN